MRLSVSTGVVGKGVGEGAFGYAGITAREDTVLGCESVLLSSTCWIQEDIEKEKQTTAVCWRHYSSVLEKRKAGKIPRLIGLEKG